MNLIEVERLARKIADVLEQRAPAAQGRQCAQDYADLCHAANHRLTQCAGMMARNENALALQLADEAPPLLDLVTRLGFRQVNEWREYCQAHELPVADALDAKAIRQLGEAYGQGLAADHQLYRQYREAVMSRKEDQAVDVLRAIVRRNPADTNAPRELERLERKVLDGELEKLRLALDGGDNLRAVGLVHEIEALNFAALPGGAVWQRAQKVRCELLLRQAAQARTRGDWNAAAPLLPQVRALRDEHELVLEASDARALAEMEAWVSERHKAREEDRKFHRTVAELQQLVAACEAKNAAGDRLPRADLRHLIESLDRQWREVERFHRELDEDLAARHRKSLLVLRAQFTQRSRTLRNAWIAGLTAFVILAVGVSVFFWRQRQAGDAAGELTTLTRSRHVAAVEKLLAKIRADSAHAAGSTPALRAALEATDSFLRAEYARRQSAEAAIARLNDSASRAFSNAPVEDIQAQFELAQKLAGEAADDLRPPLETTLAPLRRSWERALEERKQERLARFEKLVAGANQEADRGLAYVRGIEGVRTTLSALATPLEEMRLLAAPPLEPLRLPADALARLAGLQSRVVTFSNEMARWDAVQTTWRQPGSLADYLASLKLLQQSEFAAPDDKRRAGEVLGLNLTMSSLLGGLLLPGEAEAWAQFERQPNLQFTPPDVMPGERTRFNQLRDDENIFNLWQFQLTQSLSAQEARPITRTAYARGELNSNRAGGFVGLVYDPLHSPTVIKFERRDLSQNQFKISNLTRGAQSEVFERIGLKGFIDSQTGTNYGASLFGILDALNRETSGGPLFRAYLAVRLHDLMELRPASWDAHWSPAAAKDRLRLRELGAESIASGDWLAPGQQTEMALRIEEHFATARQTAYRPQAKFLGALARRTLHSGFQLVGHVDARGQPMISSTPADRAELWGWTAGGAAPVLLFRYVAKEARHVAVTSPLPFTPLFRFRDDRARLLTEVRRSASSRPAELGLYLPPFFAVAFE